MTADVVATIETAVTSTIGQYTSLVIGVLPACLGLMAVINAPKVVKKVISIFTN